MATNRELVAQAVAAIPLWQAFLDRKLSEQDALLAEMRNEDPDESKPKKLIKSLTARFSRKPPAITAKEPEIPVVLEASASAETETRKKRLALEKAKVETRKAPASQAETPAVEVDPSFATTTSSVEEEAKKKMAGAAKLDLPPKIPTTDTKKSPAEADAFYEDDEDDEDDENDDEDKFNDLF